MTLILIICIALSISLLMENQFFVTLHSADKFILSFVLYLFFTLIVTYFYTILTSKDFNRYIFSIIAILAFLILAELKNRNNYEIKMIFTNSVAITSSVVLIWVIAQINFLQDKFTTGDSYSYAFGALDFNTQGDIKSSDWTKFMTPLPNFIPSLVYFIKTLQSSSSNVEIDEIITSITFTSLAIYSFTILVIIRLIQFKINDLKSRYSLIIVSIVFMSSDFVFGPLSLGTAINATLSHMLILFAYLTYLFTINNEPLQKFSIEISMIINVLVLINNPLMLPLSAGLTLRHILVKKQFFLSWQSLVLFATFGFILFQVIFSLVRYNAFGLGGSFSKIDFELYLTIFVFITILFTIISKINIYYIYFLATITITFLYISIPYIKDNKIDLNYYNTKYLYLLIVPVMIIMLLSIYAHIEKNKPRYALQLSVFTLLALSIVSSFYNNTLVIKNLQSTSLRNSIKNLENEKHERVYYVDYIDQHDELLLNLWADTRNINYSTPWVKGNKQSLGVSTIFAEWQTPPSDRVCAYVKSFPDALIVSKNKSAIAVAKENCTFNFELR
jgi:hypothetical protein